VRASPRAPSRPVPGPATDALGLAIDRAHGILFSGCRNGVMAISDAKAGKLITTLPIGQGVDAARFDAGRQLAFASNGDGTITVMATRATTTVGAPRLAALRVTATSSTPNPCRRQT